jgi:hypothetical protein
VLTLLITPTQPLTTGEHLACLALVGRPDLRIEPDCLPLRFRVEPLWLRCRRQITWGGLVLAALVLFALLVIRAVRAAVRPPEVTGTLQHWPIGRPEAREQINLTALRRHELIIGRSPQCDVLIADSSLEERHARLRAEKEEGEVMVILEPLGKVRQGYQPLSGDLTLTQGTSFIMGEREFRYLSD